MVDISKISVKLRLKKKKKNLLMKILSTSAIFSYLMETNPEYTLNILGLFLGHSYDSSTRLEAP